MAKITLVTYELNQGGTNRVLCHLANGFVARGHAVALLYCTNARASLDLLALVQPEVQMSAMSHIDWKSRALGQVMVFSRYVRWLRESGSDVVLATGNNISWFTILGALVAGVPARRFVKTTNPIIRHRDGAMHSRVRRFVYNFIFRCCERVLTLSEAETRMLQGQFPRASGRFATVYNAYVTAQLLDIGRRRTVRVADEPRVFLAVGRLVAQKRFDRLLRAFAAAQPIDAMLRIAGEGPDRAALSALAAELGVGDKVEMPGFTDVACTMSSADVFVLSSDYEGLPAVVVEALAANLPVISTDCFANVRELIEDVPGCMVVERSEDALAQAMRTWLATPVSAFDLRPHAMPYSIDSSVDSHLTAMRIPACERA